VNPGIHATGVERPASAIYIGNSFFYYNNSVHSHVTALLAAADPGYAWRSTLVAISGSGADWHDVESYFRPDAIGRYSFDADNNVVFNKIDRLFDLALLMDGSQGPVHPGLKPIFFDFMKRHAATARGHGATPAFVMSWAYADKPRMIDDIAGAYTKLGNDNDVLVIPAGLAFADALREYPGLVLHAPDKRHPSLAGTYLMANTIYVALFGKSPVELAYTADLDPVLARFLREIAWTTTRGYYR
jgi:hypothetical protein